MEVCFDLVQCQKVKRGILPVFRFHWLVALGLSTRFAFLPNTLLIFHGHFVAIYARILRGSHISVTFFIPSFRCIVKTAPRRILEPVVPLFLASLAILQKIRLSMQYRIQSLYRQFRIPISRKPPSEKHVVLMFPFCVTDG